VLRTVFERDNAPPRTAPRFRSGELTQFSAANQVPDIFIICLPLPRKESAQFPASEAGCRVRAAGRCRVCRPAKVRMNGYNKKIPAIPAIFSLNSVFLIAVAMIDALA
jgi:hypothetical protein